MGARFKQSVVEGMRNMWNQLNEIARSHTSVQGADQLTQEETESTMGAYMSGLHVHGPLVLRCTINAVIVCVSFIYAYYGSLYLSA